MSLVFHYIIGMVPYCLFGVIICAIVRIIYYRRNNKKIEWKRELLILLFVAYCVGLASQTVIPRWDAGIDSGTGKPYFDIYWDNELASVNIVPFKTIWAQFTGNNNVVGQSDVQSVSVLNLLANLLLFSPLGFFLPVFWERFRKFKCIIEIGLIVSFCVEVIQFFVGRSSDIDDVILNTFGVITGFAVYKFFRLCK